MYMECSSCGMKIGLNDFCCSHCGFELKNTQLDNDLLINSLLSQRELIHNFQSHLDFMQDFQEIDIQENYEAVIHSLKQATNAAVGLLDYSSSDITALNKAHITKSSNGSKDSVTEYIRRKNDSTQEYYKLQEQIVKLEQLTPNQIFIDTCDLYKNWTSTFNDFSNTVGEIINSFEIALPTQDNGIEIVGSQLELSQYLLETQMDRVTAKTDELEKLSIELEGSLESDFDYITSGINT